MSPHQLRHRVPLALLICAGTILTGVPANAAPAAQATGSRPAAQLAADTSPPTRPTGLRSTRLTCQSVSKLEAANARLALCTRSGVYRGGP